MTGFQRLLTSISEKPGMYVGTPSLQAVAHFLSGYNLATTDAGKPSPMECWRQWVELNFGISDSAWHWTRILLHSYGSDEAALAALPTLFADFEADRRRVGLDCIKAQ